MPIAVHQGVLEQALSSVFPGYNVLKNARKEVSIKNPVTGEYLEVDVWYPELQLCFEYQDDHHYHPTWYSQIPLSTVQQKDNDKKNLLLQRGETLILIPCWWDGNINSLKDTVQFHRPDMNFEVGHPELIPANPPINFFSVPENLQLMLASFPSSSEIISVSETNKWWMGEKYDGVRCYWNPSERQLYSRHGLAIDVYPAINEQLGITVFDGEIWCGRGMYGESQTLIQSSVEKVNWALIRIVCFDEVSQRMIDKPFERRYACVLFRYPPEHPTVVIAARFLCTTSKSLIDNLKNVVDNGGEGIILRKPTSLYQFGRSTDLLKLKASKSDHDALVVNVDDDGSLLLQLPDGTTFTVAKSDCVLPRLPVRGDIVTFTQDFTLRRAASPEDEETQESAQHPPRDATRSVPWHALVYRIRTDVAWEDIARTPIIRQFVNEPHQKLQGYVAPKPHGLLSYENGKNMRKNLENIAKSKGIDPLVAENWYDVSRDEFMQHREVRTLVKYFGGSLAKAIVELFPELNLEIAGFSTTPVNFWAKAENRRKLYEQYAIEKGGDPFDANFWYSQNHKDLLNFKGMRTAISYYKGYVDSIVHVFPELGLNPNKFKHSPVLSWAQEKDRRAFFDNYALAEGFDPLVPANWYNVSNKSFHKYQGYDAIVRPYYGGRLSECLMQLYPDIGLQSSKFNSHKLSYWHSAENRKNALLDFAKLNSIDPLIAENWYKFSLADFESVPEVGSMLRFYKEKYIDALVDLLPGVVFDPGKFATVPFGYWADENNRKQLFLEIAKQRGFDPLVPSNWYSITNSSIENIKGASTVVKNYYRGGLAKALLHLFPNIGFEESKFREYKNKALKKAKASENLL